MRLINSEDVKALINGWDSLPFEEEVDELVDRIPTAFDVDKVVEQLEELKDKANLDTLKNMNEPIPYSSASNRVYAYDTAIEIVRNGGDL